MTTIKPKSLLLTGAIVLVTAALVVHNGCAPGLSQPDAAPDGRTADQSVQVDGHTVFFAEAGTLGQPLIVFIHGTPGSWTAFEHLLANPTLQAATHMIALDRLGFGRSSASEVVPSFATQARTVQALFARNQSDSKVIVVGHSLGGSISYQVALDYPDEVGAVLAISSAIDPALSQPRWYNRAADLGVITWLIPEGLRRANEEIMPMARQLSDIKARLHELSMPLTAIQGGNDMLVNPDTVDMLEQAMPDNPPQILRFPKAGHFLIWEQPEIIVSEILRLVDLTAIQPQALNSE